MHAPSEPLLTSGASAHRIILAHEKSFARAFGVGIGVKALTGFDAQFSTSNLFLERDRRFVASVIRFEEIDPLNRKDDVESDEVHQKKRAVGHAGEHHPGAVDIAEVHESS